MFASPRIRTYLETIYERRKLARDVLLGVLLLFGMVALWAWRYSASAIVQLTSSSVQQARASAMDAARSALSDEQLAAIMEHLQLYPEMVQTPGEASAFEDIRSRISLQAIPQGKDNIGEVRVTYLSSERATAIKVANAVAQSLTEVKQGAEDLLSVDTAATIERQLEDSRLKLKQLAVRRHKRAKNHGRHTSRRRSAQDKKKLRVQEQQRRQTSEQTSDRERVGSLFGPAEPVPVSLPETPAEKAIQQQIKDAEARLIALRQRYTDQYPDIQDTQEKLQELRSKLNRLQVESARSAKEVSPAQNGQISREDEQIGAAEARAPKETRHDAAKTKTKGGKSSKSSTVARAYEIELDRYHALLRAQRSMKEYQEERLGAPQPVFTLVQNATRAKAAGIAAKPLYWLTSLLAGLFASTLSVLFAPRLKVTRNIQRTIAPIPTIAPLPPSYGINVGFEDLMRSRSLARATSGTSRQSDPAGDPADPAGPAA